MSDRLLFNENFGDLEWSGKTQKKATLPSSSLVIPDPLLEASDYYFDIDGTTYECTGVSDTSSYLTFRYEDLDEGTTLLYIRLVKANNTVDVSIIPASFPEVSFDTSILKLYERETPIIDAKDKALIRFNRWVAVEVLYDEENDNVSYNLITEGTVPESESKYIKKVLIRFNINKAVIITLNESNNNVELEEV